MHAARILKSKCVGHWPCVKGHRPLTMCWFCPCCLDFLQDALLLNSGLEHSRSNLVLEIPNNFILEYSIGTLLPSFKLKKRTNSITAFLPCKKLYICNNCSYHYRNVSDCKLCFVDKMTSYTFPQLSKRLNFMTFLGLYFKHAIKCKS